MTLGSLFLISEGLGDGPGDLLGQLVQIMGSAGGLLGWSMEHLHRQGAHRDPIGAAE